MKSRDLTMYEFFHVLQMEWLCADLRRKIYPLAHRQYWIRVRDGKQRRFEDIAEKNHLPTILSDEPMRRSFEEKLYGAEGLPAFVYKDEADRARQAPLDEAYYFSKKAEVRFDVYGEMKVGVIKSFDCIKKQVHVLRADTEEEIVLSIMSVTRIL